MTDKQNLWKQIQERDPKLAELLKRVNKDYGKPSVTVRFKP